jgi:hypothetical protein
LPTIEDNNNLNQKGKQNFNNTGDFHENGSSNDVSFMRTSKDNALILKYSYGFNPEDRVNCSLDHVSLSG